MLSPNPTPDLYPIAARDDLEVAGWELVEDEFWFRCTPPAFPFRAQGWKIHLSAALADGQRLLDAAIGVLAEEDAAFKFAKSRDQLRALLSHRFDRGGGCKFITIYPRNDSHFTSLISLLADATREFEGPTIFSDRRVRPGSVVHYRYGAISGNLQRHRDEGSFDVPVIAPNGDFVEDERNAWFSPPEWVGPPPLPTDAHEPETSHEEIDGLLHGRYRVFEAIRHSNRGGVYRAEDTTTGAVVVAKEARPHIGPEDDGTDMTDRLRHEYAVLQHFARAHDFLPTPVELFEEGGHLFLVESEVPGVSAREWSQQRERARDDGEADEDDSTARSLIAQLEELVSAVHAEGMVLRDLTPGNLMVHDGRLTMIDPEYFAPVGELVPPAFTFGYAPLAALRQQGMAEPPGDDFSLGMCLAFLAAGVEPPIVVADTHDAVAREVIEEWLDLIAERSPLARELAPRIRTLLGLEAVRRAGDGTADDGDGAYDVVEEGLDFLTDVDWKAVREEGAAPWRIDDSGTEIGDPISAQTGLAGIVQLLADVTGTPHATAERERCLRGAAHWLADHVEHRRDRTLPGLYFGRSGGAWALGSAARALGDERLHAVAQRLLTAMPIRWHNPDMTHGLAGLGTAHLHWLRRDDHPLLERRARIIADRVAQKAEIDSDGGAVWPVATEPGVEADQAHLGYAHGVAGMGAFMLDAADYFGDDTYLDIAHAAAETIRQRAVHRASGAVDWPIGVAERDADARIVRWWCSGAGGIGSFLTRYAAVTGDGSARKLALGAARACAAEAIQLMPGHCHGISGNAHLFLDMRAAGFGADVDGAAVHSARVLRNRRISHHGHRVFPNDSGNRVSVSYGQGVSGPLSFLVRLLHETDRPFYWNPAR